MKTYPLLVLGLFALGFFACESGAGSQPAAGAVSTELTGFATTPIPGTDYVLAEKRNADGQLVEAGRLRGDTKDGTWVTYHPDKEIPATVADYVNGNYSGTYQTFNNRGQLEMIAGYVNNQLHGKYAKYKFGRKTEEGEYNNGKETGVWTVYYNNKDIPQKMTTYLDGQMNGPLRFYDEEGNVTVEYEYRNGEKVSGGIIE